MDKQRGRNDPCWCGSGKKYKKCHLGRSDQDALSYWDAAKQMSDAFSMKTCMAPSAWHGSCRGKIVRAHTVPRSGSLSQIARDGHVYSFTGSAHGLSKSGGVLKPQLVGVRQASTFNGFCEAHDSGIFAPLEASSFTATDEQCFLLAFRAFTYEVYKKHAALESVPVLRQTDRGRTVAEQLMVQQFVSDYEAGTRAAIRDSHVKRPLFDAALVNGDYSSIRAFVLEVDPSPPVMCSGGFGPEEDFGGGQLQDVRDLGRILDLMTVSSFGVASRGAVVFAWLADDDATCRPLAESLDSMNDDDMTDAVVTLLFEHCENVHMQPDWWEALTDAQRQALEERMRASADMHSFRGKGLLLFDGLKLPAWGFCSRRWVN